MQYHESWEHIVVDDGSTDETRRCNDDHFIRYIHIEHAGRVIARNTGMEATKGEWICWLDDDDAYSQMYLATFAYNIKRNPDAKLWVCGAVVHGMEKENGVATVPTWTTLRNAWMPPVDANGVHADFKSGKVGTGMFVFHRSCMEKIGVMPAWKNHDDIAEGCNEWLGYDTGYRRGGPWAGNPNGCDWVYFRRLTQFYQVHLINACLYTHYVR